MAFNDADFVDRDYQASRLGQAGAGAGPSVPAVVHGTGAGGSAGGVVGGFPPAAGGVRKAPTREELDSQLTSTQQQLARLREAQEQLERARAEVEELRRKQGEFYTSRDELRSHLTRGTALLEEAEFKARREAEQLGQTLGGLKEALQKVEAIQEALWTEEDWNQEMSRALVTLENARMEWNGARLKWPLLDGQGVAPVPGGAAALPPAGIQGLATLSWGSLLRLGLALTWPLAVVLAVAMVVLGMALVRR